MRFTDYRRNNSYNRSRRVSKEVMILDTGTLIAIIIALAGSLTVMGLFWRENIALQRQIRVLLHEEHNNG